MGGVLLIRVCLSGRVKRTPRGPRAGCPWSWTSWLELLDVLQDSQSRRMAPTASEVSLARLDRNGLSWFRGLPAPCWVAS